MTEPTDNSLPKPGETLLGKFRVERVVGQGAAGIVYAAHHELLDQRVALKVLLAAQGSEAALRFVNEGKLAAKIRSEHACRVMDVGMLESGIPYIAMEYLDGRDLDAVIASGRTPVGVAADYLLQALDAVAQAHAHGIVHRDLKPANLFLAASPEWGHPIVKVLDFGISKVDLGTDTNVTSSRTILGSPSYMSPEQIKNAKLVDLRTDIWSLGVILFELVAGRPPFDGETVGEVFAKILEAAPPPLREIVPDVPEAFESIVTRCLARDREERFSNVAELAEALQPFAGEMGSRLVPRIARAMERTPSLSDRDSDPGSAARVRRNVAATTTIGTSVALTRARRGRLGWALMASALVVGGTSAYLFATDRLPWSERREGRANGEVDGGSRSEVPDTLGGILSGMTNALSSFGADAGADAASSAASVTSAPPQRDAGRKPATKPASTAKTKPPAKR
jgi:serine/threonine-protein kinase